MELAEKYNTFIIEDAPYTLLSFSGEIPPAIKSFDTTERVIYIGSVSKIMAPGMRVGWTVGSLHFTQQMVYIKMIDDLQVNNLAQRQVHRYLSEYDVDEGLCPSPRPHGRGCPRKIPAGNAAGRAGGRHVHVVGTAGGL